MERAGYLIEKLLADYRNQSTPEQLMVTLQLIQKELLLHQAQAVRPSTRRVAVVMPAGVSGAFGEDLAEMTLTYKNDPEPIPEPVIVPEPKPVAVAEPHYEPAPEIPEPVIPQPEPVLKKPLTDVNSTIAENDASLNDRLKENTTELGEVLHHSEPLKDLRKGIGVNDRYLFVNELFRGDETMYERSIKTINGFNILPEAQYWIERELKIKLGWSDAHETVKQFYALVKRRFSAT